VLIRSSVRDAVAEALDTALQEGFEHALAGQIAIEDFEVQGTING
jgi:hypothetical protein